VRLAGRGHDGRFGIASGALSLAGCFLGNFLASAFSVAAHDHASYVTYAMNGLPHVAEIIGADFQWMDLIFYAIGTYFGYRYALAPLRTP